MTVRHTAARRMESLLAQPPATKRAFALTRVKNREQPTTMRTGTGTVARGPAAARSSLVATRTPGQLGRAAAATTRRGEAARRVSLEGWERARLAGIPGRRRRRVAGPGTRTSESMMTTAGCH